jgi:hypothetical protein
MLAGDFSELLTGGTSQGNVINPATSTPYINACTGLPYQYGQIFDPLRVVDLLSECVDKMPRD